LEDDVDTTTISLAIIFLWTWMAFAHALHDCVARYGCLFSSQDGRLMYCSLWFMVWARAGTTFAALLYSTNDDDDDDDDYDYVTVLTYMGIELAISWLI
jgi:hypothetical protein